jgi:hypothetical protein
MRFAASLAIVAALALVVGCGGSGNGSGSTSTKGAKAAAREARADFLAEPSCKRPAGASRWGCSVGSYRCQGVVTDHGWSISCSRPGRSVAFILHR